MVKTNEDSVVEGKGQIVFDTLYQCIRMMVLWQSITKIVKLNIITHKKHKKLLNAEFACSKRCLIQANTASGVPRLIDKDMVIESIAKMRNAKFA